MTPIKLTATVQPGGTLTLDHLPFAAGETVEVVLSTVPALPPADPTEGGKYPLRGQPYHYPDPFGPACDPDDWECMK